MDPFESWWKFEIVASFIVRGLDTSVPLGPNRTKFIRSVLNLHPSNMAYKNSGMDAPTIFALSNASSCVFLVQLLAPMTCDYQTRLPQI